MKKKVTKLMLCAGGLLASAQGFAQDTAMERLSPSALPNTLSVGANIGVADVEDVNGNIFAFGVFADYALAPSFSVGGTVDYWNDAFDASGDRRIEVEDTAFGINGKFKFPDVAAGLRPYALAGVALHRFAVDVGQRDLTADPVVDKFSEYDKETADVNGEFGVDFAGGVQYAVQNDIDVTGEVRYRRIIDRTVALDQLNFTAALSYAM